MRAKIGQSIFLGVLFIGWAFSTYGATFDGTGGGLATTFFTVFGVDVGLDALLARFRGGARA